MRYLYHWGFVQQGEPQDYTYVLRWGFVWRTPKHSTDNAYKFAYMQPIRYRPGQIIDFDANMLLDLVSVGTQGAFIRRRS